ncbi:MAG TPA: SIS domain-containing protein [Gammaproteobacteria bacterium]|nr:SIS domain-containing protein [Gammaproteobacteria bacterium]
MNNDLLHERIKHQFSESIQVKIMTADALLPAILLAAEKLTTCLLNGHKAMSCGNGASACDALRFAEQMLNRFKGERPPLPALALTADTSVITGIANDSAYQDIFAKQIRALGQSGDILLIMSSCGNSANILHAIKAAHDRNINVIAITADDGGKIAEQLRDSDVEIRVPSSDTARAQETHVLIIHCLCDIVDCQLFGQGELNQ